MDNLIKIPDGYILRIGDQVAYKTSSPSAKIMIGKIISLQGSHSNWEDKNIYGILINFYEGSLQTFNMVLERDELSWTMDIMRDININKILN